AGAGVGVGRPAHREGCGRQRPDLHRVQDGQRAARQAAAPVRPRPDGPGEPDRRGARREPAARRGPRGRPPCPPGPQRARVRSIPAGRRRMSTVAPATTFPRVLVVDDELGPRESLRMLLKPAYHIQTAENGRADRKSTRLNSSHGSISYAVFCLKKKKQHHKRIPTIEQTMNLTKKSTHYSKESYFQTKKMDSKLSHSLAYYPRPVLIVNLLTRYY